MFAFNYVGIQILSESKWPNYILFSDSKKILLAKRKAQSPVVRASTANMRVDFENLAWHESAPNDL